MTTISPIRGAERISFRPPLALRAVSGVLGAVMLSCVTAIAVLACITSPAALDGKLMTDIQDAMLSGGSATATCGRDGMVEAPDPGNCRDMSGFRIVTGQQIRVFSLRYDKPLFIFGIENGMMFTNERIPAALLNSEKSSFVRYVRTSNE